VSPHQRKISFIVERLLEWYPKNARDLPWRRTNDPYCVFVSEIMLQQTQVKTVVPYWERWMRELPTVASLARAKPQRIHKLWEGLGYYTRVRNMQKAAQIIVEEHGGAFPSRFEEVLRLPGIGRYTAGAICSIALGQPTPILDGNVLRVLTRLFGIGGNPRDKQVNGELWRLAEELVRAAGHVVIGKGKAGSRSPCSQLNQGLMELGALVCTPRQPQCGVCPVAGCCTAWKEGRVERLPEIGPRPPETPRRFVAFVVARGGRYLVRQRPAGVVNGHLWEFPNLELKNGSVEGAARRVLGIAPGRIEPYCTIKHSITRYRNRLEAYRVYGLKQPAAGDARNLKAEGAGSGLARPHVGGNKDGLRSRQGACVWLTLRELDRLPFASAHKKILCQLQKAVG
jgi:A/G-specific adenine glycosylase